MGAGKSTVGARVAELTARPFVDLDGLIERRHGPIPELFERGEPEFRRIEEETLAQVLAGPNAVIALGGGAVLSPLNRERLRARAFTVYLDVALETAWARVRGSDRPLAQHEDDFRRLYESRQSAYAEAADAVASGVEDVLLSSLGVRFGGLTAPLGAVEVVADTTVLELHPAPVEARIHRLPPGEEAKSLSVVEALWRKLTLGRDGTIVAFGGGSTTDVAGFVAATYLRGIPWIAVPTTLTGQVDAAIGGKTGINTTDGKNLAVRDPVVRPGLERVRERMPEVEPCPPPLRLVGVGEDDTRLVGGAGADHRLLVQLPQRPAGKEACLDDLGHACSTLGLRERRKQIRVDHDTLREVEGAGEVLPVGRVDPGLAADGGVHLAGERRRDGDPRKPTQVRSGDEAGHVRRRAAAEGDDRPVAAER